MNRFPNRRALVKKATLTCPALALAIALAGCGNEDSDAASGPASVMPAESPIYFEATIRPESEQAEDIDALLTELGELPLIGSVGDPGDLIIDQLEAQAAAAGVDFSYAEDIEPWLGERVGISVVPSDTEDDIVVAAFETTDEEAARESIEGLLEQGSTDSSEEEYEGVSYLTSPSDDFSFGVFDGHAVFATPDAFEDAVDASEDESLGESDKLAQTTENLDEGSLVSVYLDIAQFEEFAESPEDAEEFEQAQAIVPELFEGAIAFSAGVSASDQVFIDYATPLIEGQPEAGASELLSTAPGDALGAFALEEIGAFGPLVVDLFERAEEEGADLGEDYPEEGIEQAFEDETGIPFDDAAEAIGDASVYVRGDLPDEFEVGGEIEVTDTEVATDLLEAAQAQIEEDESAKLGPPVGGSDVGFSVLDEEGDDFPAVDDTGFGAEFDTGAEEFEVGVVPNSSRSDLPFANIELDGDVIRYGFLRDEAAADASDAASAGDFADSDAYAAGQEAIGDDFEYLGAVDLQPILDEFLPSPGVEDAILGGGSPEELIGPFIAGKLGVVAFGQRYEDDVAITRYLLELNSE